MAKNECFWVGSFSRQISKTIFFKNWTDLAESCIGTGQYFIFLNFFGIFATKEKEELFFPKSKFH